MESRSYHLHDGRKGAALVVRVTPRASMDEIVDILSDGTIKVHLMAPPVEGRANAALLKFLAGILDIPQKQLDVVAGFSGRDKLVSVMDMDAETVHKKIMDYIG